MKNCVFEALKDIRFLLLQPEMIARSEVKCSAASSLESCKSCVIFIYLFIYFYVLACSAGRLSSWAWWSAQTRHGAGSFVYSDASYTWLMLPPGTPS